MFSIRLVFKVFGLVCVLITTLSAQAFAEDKKILQHPIYQKLRQALPLYEEAVRNPWPTLYSHRVLELNVNDPAVIVLRERLRRTGELDASESINDVVFDTELERAVRLFQERHGLQPDGVVGRDTRNALNISPEKRVHQIRVNLHRWAQFIPQAGSRYIWINVPDYRLRLVDNHQTILTSRVIVGKPTRATPEIDSHVKRIILNPTWTVPPTIAKQDIIPTVIANPQYLTDHHMRIYSIDRPGVELNISQSILNDLWQNPSRYIIRQDPGPHNALGQIKFEFDNRHSVYLHDTPSKALFEQEKRLFSSGCVRLQNPLILFSALSELDDSLKAQMHQVEQALESGVTTSFKLGNPIPIRVTYITVWVDDTGALHFWDDVYNRDHRLVIQKNTEQRNLPQPI
jgi:L,D-transpeptidase YcbB